MTFNPNEKQSLLLWRMLTAESEETRSPLQSKTKPKISIPERETLVKNGFLEITKLKKGARLDLTDKAWAWASTASNVRLLKSNSTVGAIALEGLLHRLIPFLIARGIPLSEVLTQTPQKNPSVATTVASETRDDSSLVAQLCSKLNRQKPNTAIRLTYLRSLLPTVPRQALDNELRNLHAEGRIVLYRDDNSAAVTTEDNQSALIVGEEPRHLLYWKD
jgi:hypothetical protein